MKKAYRMLRDRRSMYLGIAVLGVSGIGTFAASNASADEPFLGALATSVTCSSTSTACVKGNNTNTGSGVTGASSKGPGVLGQGTSSYGVKATSSKAYGVFGSSTSGLAGVAGTTASNYGVYGYTTGSGGGTGVYGSSKSGYGVYGTTTSNGLGVYGYGGSGGTGLYGVSTTGYGTEGVTGSGYGFYADAYNGGIGVFSTTNTGFGVVSYTGGSVPFWGSNSNGNGADIRGTYIGIVARAPASGGFPLVLTDSAGNNIFQVDGGGNVRYKGSIGTFARLANGATANSFSAESTRPTVEDTGTAQLSNGTAVVRLDPTFAASIDASSSYRVFITPNGDTRGLFVPTKTAKGFIVREAQAGHASVSFDYRIVATKLGQTGQRMAPLLADSASLARAALPLAPKRPLAQRSPEHP